MIVIICAKYKKESIQNCRRYRADTIFYIKAEWPWRYRSRSKVIVFNTPSRGSDNLWLIWKESIQNCRCYRTETAGGTDGRMEEGQTEGWTEWNQYTPEQRTTKLFGGYKK